MKRLGLLVVALLVLVAAFGVRQPADPALWPPGPADERVTIYLIDNGYHSNLVLPRDRLAASGGPSVRALAAVPSGPWIAVGWGDERFFTESGMNPRRALDGLRALFAPENPSVTMFEPLAAAPDRLWRTGVVRIDVSKAGFAAMTARIDRSLRLADGAPIPGPAGSIPQARFFKSVEHFSLLRLCNHWASDVLHAGGLPVRPVMDTLGSGLAFDLRTGALKDHAGVPDVSGLSGRRVQTR